MRNILNIEFESRDLGRRVTVRGYLQELLLTLFEREDGFSGKRPFGNSGWKYDLIAPLVKAGKICGELDEDGGVDSYDAAEFNEAIAAAIRSL